MGAFAPIALSDVVLVDARAGTAVDLGEHRGTALLTLIRHRY
ncbi:MAG TPA: hypothetical protein VG266_11210 [Candidatus Dormibacteraeota bacterium]|jgi:hypothetical protein|nr:hypothetical protein [Candidatus Dormibacteraeota bacterium]